MASVIEICNRALTKLGESRILALTDDSKAARTLNSMYAIVRDAELRASRWRFSIKRASLAELAAPPEYGFVRQFQLPTDCLKVLEAGDRYPGVDLSDYVQTDNSDYAIEGNAILTNWGAPLRVRYVARITDPTLFDACFVESLACRLAFESAEAITDSTTRKQQLERDYERAMMDARKANAIERPPQKMADDTWMIARL